MTTNDDDDDCESVLCTPTKAWLQHREKSGKMVGVKRKFKAHFMLWISSRHLIDLSRGELKRKDHFISQGKFRIERTTLTFKANNKDCY